MSRAGKRATMELRNAMQLPLVDGMLQKSIVEQEPNPMRRAFGPGPEGTICRGCVFLVGKRWDKTYWKCGLRQNTNGPGTDHRVRWKSCSKFEKRPDETPRKVYTQG